MSSALPLAWGGSCHAPVSAPTPALLLQSPRVLWCCHQPQHVGNLLGLLLESQQTRAVPLESSGRVCGLSWTPARAWVRGAAVPFSGAASAGRLGGTRVSRPRVQLTALAVAAGGWGGRSFGRHFSTSTLKAMGCCPRHHTDHAPAAALRSSGWPVVGWVSPGSLCWIWDTFVQSQAGRAVVAESHQGL